MLAKIILAGHCARKEGQTTEEVGRQCQGVGRPCPLAGPMGQPWIKCLVGNCPPSHIINGTPMTHGSREGGDEMRENDFNVKAKDLPLEIHAISLSTIMYLILLPI